MVGVPFERPDEFGTRLYLTDAELKAREAAAVKQQQLDVLDFDITNPPPEIVALGDVGNGTSPPPHWLERGTPSRRTSMVIDPANGRLPAMTAAARSRRGEARGVSTNRNPVGPFNSWLDMGLYDRCITRGIPASMMPAGYGSYYRIVQSPDSVALTYEMIHETRVVPFSLPGSSVPRVSPSIKQFLGDARAWWEGETLVVETRNFPAETAPQRASTKVTMTERFTPVGPNLMEWRVTFDDASTWVRPWTYMMPLTKVAGTQEVHEYACHEGNNAMRNILSAQRAADRATGK
jgi:hypothetical protein